MAAERRLSEARAARLWRRIDGQRRAGALPPTRSAVWTSSGRCHRSWRRRASTFWPCHGGCRDQVALDSLRTCVSANTQVEGVGRPRRRGRSGAEGIWLGTLGVVRGARQTEASSFRNGAHCTSSGDRGLRHFPGLPPTPFLRCFFPVFVLVASDGVVPFKQGTVQPRQLCFQGDTACERTTASGRSCLGGGRRNVQRPLTHVSRTMRFAQHSGSGRRS